MKRARVTLNVVNAALAAAGHAEQLVRGAGYFYFCEGNASAWPSSGVYGVARLGDLSLAEWIAEHDRLAAEWDAPEVAR